MADEKIMERVTRLLALAEHPNTPPAEAELALQQANKLMAKHAIEEALLRQRQTASERRALVSKTIEVGGGYTFSAYLRTVLTYAMETSRCSGVHLSDGSTKIYGAKEDVDWVEMLYSMIRLQFLSRIDPKWDEAKSYDENVYNFKVAGYKWAAIDEQSRKHGGPDARVFDRSAWIAVGKDGVAESLYWNEQVENGNAQLGEFRGIDIIERELLTPNGKIKGTMITAYRRWAKLVGDSNPVSTQNQQAYRISYAEGFRSRMAVRFQKLKEDADRERDTIPGAALALSDIKDEAQRMIWEDFPTLSPEHLEKVRQETAERQRREAEERQRMLDAMTPKQREAFLEKEEREKHRNYKSWQKYQEQEYKLRHDQGARAQGAAAANAVDLSRKAGATEAAEGRAQLT